jgi:hypothetical protein
MGLVEHFDVNLMTGRPKFIVRHSTLLFKKNDDDVITLARNTCIQKCYVNKREIEIKNRPVFVLFSKLNCL